MKYAALLTLTLLTATCDSPTGPIATSGTYELVRIDGESLPTSRNTPPAPGVDGHWKVYRSGSMVIDGDVVTRELHKDIEWPRFVWTPTHIVTVGRLVRHSHQNRIEQTQIVYNGEPINAEGSWVPVEHMAGDSIVLIDEGGHMVYRRR